MAELQTILGFNRSSFLTWAGLAGAAFVGYAIYFDNKRRSQPDYKQKIREKRHIKARGVRPSAAGAGAELGGMGAVPDPSNPTQMQAFFLQEVQLGEELMATGNVEEGAIHICNAIALCGQSQQLMSIFQQTLPPEQFAAVLEKLPGTRERLSAMFGTDTQITEIEEHDDVAIESAATKENNRLADMFGAMADAAEAEVPAFSYMGDGPPPPQIQELISDDLDLE